GGGKTGLTIRLETAGVEGQVLGQDEASVKQENGLRIAGTLQAPVPFEQAGSFVVLAVIRTAVSPGEITMLDADQQQDTDIVRIEVEVIGQPEVGAIRGRVTAETDGVPLEGMILRVYQADTGRLVQYTRTGQDGTYLASGIPAGAYLVHADPQQQGYLPEWYDDAATRADADPVAVASGQTTDGVDFALSRGGVISGWVYEDDPDSTSGQPTPIANAMILVGPYVRPDGTTSPEYEGERLYKARTQRDGSYRVEGLPPGAYWVYAGDDSQSLIGEYYNDKPSREQADPVAVRAGQETENITFRLRYGGAIAGYVWGAHILPVEPIQSPEREVALLTPFKVTAYDWETGQAVRTIGVDRRGFYTIPGLPEGGYRVYAFDEAGQYIPEYYDDVTDPREATKVQVRRGATTPDINFQLSLAGVAIVQVRPPMTQVRPGDAFEIAVWAKDVTSLGGFAFDLYYDARVLSVIETSVALGDFLGSTGRTVFPLGPQFSEGLVRFGGGSLGDAAGPDGSGVLARMRFEAVTPGKSALALANTTLTDTEARPIRSQAYDG
ncbi:MAG: hypothetical protein FJZ90_19305, partial [Chloroflexi bacterium]|nr:hypothetical protein [Chloroflexota bacterium]